MSRPWVDLCLATSLDGRIASKPDGPPDFTSREDLEKLFRLRSEADALLIGAGTVRREQVLPLVRNEVLAETRERSGKTRHPAAVVVSGSLNLPWDGRYFRYRKQAMFIMTGKASVEAAKKAAERDVSLIETGEPLNLAKGLSRLGELGFHKVLAEGGGSLARALLAEDLIDRVYLTIAPVFIGGTSVPLLVNGAVLAPMRRFHLESCLQHEDELHLTYTRDQKDAATNP